MTTSPRQHPRPSPRLRRELAALVGAALIVAPAIGAAAELTPRVLIDRVTELLEEASAERVPPRRPPTPIKVSWKAKRLGSVDLGAPLITLTSGDLDGDGRAELVAVTERDVVILAPQGRRAVAEVARLALPAEAPSVQPRDPVAAAVVIAGASGAELRVRASTSGRGARYTYANGKLREAGSVSAYPLCADRDGALARGRNYYQRDSGDAALPASWPAKLWAARCRDDLVDPVGRALRVDAVLGARGALAATVAVRCDDGEADCVAERSFAIAGVGIAYALADVDRDGKVEIITSAASAPGDADKVSVYSLPAAGEKLGKPVFKKGFTGGVGGLAADDVDGDGDIEVIAAVRLPGAERVDLWLLD